MNREVRLTEKLLRMSSKLVWLKATMKWLIVTYLYWKRKRNNLSSSRYLRSVVSNVHAISFQKIYIEESLMRYWRLDCRSSAKRWRCVDVLLTKRSLFLIFVMMIVCLMIFVQCNCRFSSTWSLYLEMTKTVNSFQFVTSDVISMNTSMLESMMNDDWIRN